MCSFFVVSCYSTRGTVEEAADQTGYKHQHQTSNVVSSLVQDCRQSKILELNCTDPRESLLYRSRTASCRDAAACKWRGTGSGRRQNLRWDDTDGRMLMRLFRGPGLLLLASAAVRVDSGHAAIHMRVKLSQFFSMLASSTSSYLFSCVGWFSPRNSLNSVSLCMHYFGKFLCAGLVPTFAVF